MKVKEIKEIENNQYLFVCEGGNYFLVTKPDMIQEYFFKFDEDMHIEVVREGFIKIYKVLRIKNKTEKLNRKINGEFRARRIDELEVVEILL